MALPVTRRRERLIPTQWSAFPEFEELYNRMERLLESAVGEPIISPVAWTPFADLLEDEQSYIVEAELPGMSKDDINIQVNGNELVISGNVEEEEKEGVRAHRRRRRYGEFEYRTMLPGKIDAEGVRAKLDNGVLTVTAPKSAHDRPRKVAIES